ncbi:MAG: methyltransferase domain-containing protein [Pseudorhodoplanes sp.]|nr:methyltransferase domain-containing protein [Pseudorhodoplanes sp.]GIK82041.1 MAG: hypothetical protein BroJett024_31460 [Alphaproteobacteria bacterium]
MTDDEMTGTPAFEQLRAIAWPLPPGAHSAPRWTGDGFIVDGRPVPVLQNRVGDTGWNDDLAALVEAEVSAERPIGIASRRYAIESLARYGAIRPDGIIMEIGCASGYLLGELRRRSAEVGLIGCDYALQPLLGLAERLRGIPLLQLDLGQSSLPGRMCDAVVMQNVLEHIEDDAVALREVARLLRPNGLLVLEVPAGPQFYDSFDRLVGHFRRYRMRELTAKVRDAGFEILDRSHLGFLAYPAFWLLKRYGKLRGGDQGPDYVLRTLRAGRAGPLQRAVAQLESALRPYLPMPIGIRCLLTARVK